jgi:hypothetical protein
MSDQRMEEIDSQLMEEIDSQLMDLCAASCCAQTATLLTEWLDRTLHGDSWARDASTRQVWQSLLSEVHRLNARSVHGRVHTQEPAP